MPFNERKTVIENLSMVDEVIDFEDDNIGSATNALKHGKKVYPSDEIIFANGEIEIKTTYQKCLLMELSLCLVWEE